MEPQTQAGAPARPKSPRAEAATRGRRRGVYHGWHIVWVAFLSTGFTIGMSQYAFGVFIEPLETEFGWSRAQVNASLSIGLLGALLAPVVGTIMDRIGARPVMLVSICFLAAAFVLFAVMNSLWQYYAASILVYCGYPGATMLPAGRLIGIWFPRIQGRMMGLVMSGNNFGGLTMVPLASAVVAIAGWRWAYGVFAALLAALTLAIALVIRDRPAEPPAIASGGTQEGQPRRSPLLQLTGLGVREALHTPAFYLITAAITAASFTYSAVITQIIPHLKAQGFSNGAAAAGLSVVALFGILSKVSFGRLSEGMNARRATILSLVIQGAGLGLLVLAGGSGLAWLAVVVFGSGFGGLGALIPLVVAEAFGLRNFGSLLGIVNLAGILPIVVGPLMAGIIFDRTESYDVTFTVIIGLFVLASFLMALVRPPAAKGAAAPA